MTKKVNKKNCLAALFPKLAKEWHHKKNGKLKPEDVSCGADKKVWWKCSVSDDHVWQAFVYRRTNPQNASGCPYCAGQKTAFSNCLTTTHPDLASEWDYTANGDLTPEEITAGHNGKVHWICRENSEHRWLAKVASRSSSLSTGCPYCAGQAVHPKDSLQEQYPDLSSYWHPTMNGELTAAMVLPNSNKYVWWKCPAANDHVWESSVDGAIKVKNFCPFCDGRRASQDNSLLKTHPNLAAQWHPDKNGKLTPSLITSSYSKLVWWQCSAANDHEWEARPNKRARNDNGCPICANRKVVKSNCIETTDPQMAREWHPTKNHPRTPQNTATGFGGKVWWMCTENNEHVWHTSPVSRRNNKSGCPFCGNRKVSKTNNLAYTHPHIAAEWHSELNGKVRPVDIVSGSPKKAWWQCPNNPDHIWEAKIENRTRLGSGCPHCSDCVSMEATLLFQRLSSLVKGLVYEGQENVDIEALKIPTWRRTFDAAIPQLSLFIEYDGAYFHQNQKARDIRKNEAAEELGYTVLRIRPEPLEKVRAIDVLVPSSYNTDIYVKIVLEHLWAMFSSDI